MSKIEPRCREIPTSCHLVTKYTMDILGLGNNEGYLKEVLFFPAESESSSSHVFRMNEDYERGPPSQRSRHVIA